MKLKNKIQLLFLCLGFTACSSTPVFTPEVGDDGAQFSKGGVVYSIPQRSPVLKMKLISMFIPKKKMVHVRIYFKRMDSGTQAFMDPQEQNLFLAESKDAIHPSRVHADQKGKPRIQLANQTQQAVELLFPVPADGDHRYPFITLQWKIHYKNGIADQTMTENVRFDYVQRMSPQQGVGQYEGDLEFPAVSYLDELPPMWMGPGWMWW